MLYTHINNNYCIHIYSIFLRLMTCESCIRCVKTTLLAGQDVFPNVFFLFFSFSLICNLRLTALMSEENAY